MAPRAPKKTDDAMPGPEKKPAAKAKTTTTTRKRTLKAVEPLQITPDEIAMRAYFIAMSGEGGDDMENWLRAEQELMARAA